jgi:carbamoyl-phosphate synthase large subunit
LVTPHPERLSYIRYALGQGMPIEQIQRMTGIDRWFLEQLKDLAEFERKLESSAYDNFMDSDFHVSPRDAKRMGLSDAKLASIFTKAGETDVNATLVYRNRVKLGIVPVYKRVDTCAAEFESFTPYLYSTYEDEDEATPTDRKKVLILGSGPNRIGQGIEFDYCCCHAAFALRDDGYETVMVNCNPETVSTDYDTSDRLYFEPLTFEDVMNVIEHEQQGGAPVGVIVQYGGQTPLNLALPLKAAGATIIGTSPESIDLAEDRKRFGKLLEELDIPQPAGGTAISIPQALAAANGIGYPVLVRPSYVLGGRAMVIAYDDVTVERYMKQAVEYSQERPVLIDHFLEDATEFDVDCLSDGEDVVIAGIMQHIEEAGIHSGDSSCVLPAVDVPQRLLDTIRDYTFRLARALQVVGLMNVQYAIQNERVFVIEVNPRASRTVPYVSKATGVPLAKIAARLMTGRKLREFLPENVERGTDLSTGDFFYVKSPVFPWSKFPGTDVVLGPEMKSTGEVMGVADNFGEAFAKAQLAAGQKLPTAGAVFISVNDRDKPQVARVARLFADLGFRLVATHGTANVLEAAGMDVERVYKVKEGRPNVVDLMKRERIQLIVNTPMGVDPFFDDKAIRREAIAQRIPAITTVSAARAAAEGITAIKRGKISVRALQELHALHEKKFAIGDL